MHLRAKIKLPEGRSSQAFRCPRCQAQRDTIARAGPSYLVMGYSAMGISFLYSILMVLFVLFSAASR